MIDINRIGVLDGEKEDLIYMVVYDYDCHMCGGVDIRFASDSKFKACRFYRDMEDKEHYMVISIPFGVKLSDQQMSAKMKVVIK